MINNGFVTKYKIDSLGSEWTNDISHTYARNNGDQDFTINFYIPASPPVGGDGNSLNKRTFIYCPNRPEIEVEKKLYFGNRSEIILAGFQ